MAFPFASISFVFSVLFNLLHPGECYGSGAPMSDTLCKEMLPGHPNTSPQVAKTNPYSIQVEPTVVNAGDTLNVTISSKTGESLAGFLLLGRLSNSRDEKLGLLDSLTAHGSFKPIKGISKTGDCFNTVDAAATHVSDSAKKNITLEWAAPQNGDGSYRIVGTILRTYAIYWGNILSDEIKVLKRSDIPHVHIVKPPAIPNSREQSKEEENLTEDFFYERCKSFGCFTVPAGCSERKTCKMMAAFSQSESDGDKFIVQLMGKPTKMTNGYVALGISPDDTMGGDSVFGCFFDGTRIKAIESCNAIDDAKYNRVIEENEKSLISNRTAMFDDYLICEFQIQSPINISSSNNKGDSIDLNRENFLLFARGPARKDYFGLHPMTSIWVSEKAVKFSDTLKITEQSRVLFQAHGSLLIIAWVLLSSIGTFTARYHKQTFGDYNPCGKALWFVIHQSCMVTTVFFTIVGIALMIAQMKGISKMKSNNMADVAHPIIGFVLLGFVMFQVVLALCRPDPTAGTIRKVFNWLHFLIGNTAYILAFVCIFLAWELSKSRFDPGFYGILNYNTMLVVFLSFHVIAHILMSVHTFMMDWKYSEENNTNFRGIIPGPMKNSSSPMEPKGSGYRTAMLLMEVCIATFISLYLVVEVCNS